MSTSMSQSHPVGQTAQEKEKTMTILIADNFESSGIAALEQLGCDVELDPSLQGESLADVIREKDPSILIVRSTRVQEAAIKAGRSLSLIVRAGAGYDSIDIASASAQGISVANCPGMNALAVAELAWGLILSCDRRIPDQTRDLRDGVWNKKEYAKASGLHGRTLGVVGLGRIGQAVAERGRAFGMNVISWSRSLTPETADENAVGYCEELTNLARMSDVISINVAANKDTAHLIDERFCDAMRPGTILVNTSRGSVIDEAALIRAIREKKVRAGLDVFAEEPSANAPEFKDPIVKEEGVYGSHHIGASTSQAQEAIANETVRIIKTWVATGQVPNCVNLASRTAASEMISIRHLNKPGVLAHVFEVLGRCGVNVEEMENVIYDEAVAACARIQIGGTLKDTDLAAIDDNKNIISITRTSI
jgi:D-3-phosphoglycerate dehydrogenase